MWENGVDRHTLKSADGQLQAKINVKYIFTYQESFSLGDKTDMESVLGAWVCTAPFTNKLKYD